MTVKTIRTNPEEMKEICEGDLRYVIRSDKELFNKGDFIQFQLYRDQKPVRSRMDKKAFIVTSVKGWLQAPINKGHQLIGFKEVLHG